MVCYFINSFCLVHLLWLSLLLLFYYYIFHTSVRWWSFTGVWVTASLFMSLGLFSIFWPFSTMLLSRWPQFFLWFSILPIPFSCLWGPFQTHRLQVISLSASCFTVCFFVVVVFFCFFSLFLFLVLRHGSSICLSFSFLSSLLWGTAKSTRRQVRFFTPFFLLGRGNYNSFGLLGGIWGSFVS